MTPGLAPPDHRRAVEAGPWAVDTEGCSYPALLTAAGFDGVEAIDVTAAYRATQARWLHHARALRDRSVARDPSCRFAERIEEQSVARAAVEQGLLGRALFLASRPPGPGPGSAEQDAASSRRPDGRR